jgi:hypothetical protein
MTKIHIIREGKPLVEIGFERTPADGTTPSRRVAVQSSVKNHAELCNALASALIRIVDDGADLSGPEIIVELGSDSYEN